jgi:hypothetical protein
MRLTTDCTVTEDLQAGRAWTAAGWKIADQIDREMCAPEGIARLERAAEVMALLDYAQTGAVEIRMVRGELRVSVVDLIDPAHSRVYVSDTPQAIAAAAEWIGKVTQ